MLKCLTPVLSCFLLFIYGPSLLAQNGENVFWKPVMDQPYLQESSELIPTGFPVTQVAVLNGMAYVVAEGSLNKLDNYDLIA
ncbi:MAG: hypothetical protein WDZ72_02505, partial [Cyclobacteriaceae bacterium]